MVKHVVMWRYKDKQNIEIARNQLESLRGKIPGMLSLETGENFTDSDASWDLVLITEHPDRETLDAYQENPLHVEVKAVLGKIESERAVVDFEI